MKKAKWYVEIILEGDMEMVFASDIRPAKLIDIQKARKLHKRGKCPHNIVFDTEGYPIDIRTCAICKKSLGTI